jgi:hypothetical protein
MTTLNLPRVPRGLNRIGWLALVAGLVGDTSAAAAPPTLPPPADFSASEDHQRLMDLLHITEFRRAQPSNYDESKANPDPDLPDPLT